MRNPAEETKRRYLWHAKKIKRRIYYCRYRARRVGSLKRRRAWQLRAVDARDELSELQSTLLKEANFIMGRPT